MNARLALALTLVSATGATRVAIAEPHYSLPWQLRPVSIDNLVRVDSAAAVFNDDNGNLDVADTTVLAAGYRLTEHWAPTLRLGFAGNNAPGAAVDGSSFANPVVGATYARTMDRYQLVVSWATTIPIGMGGGDDPDSRAARANAASVTARPMDSAMFEVNYLTEIVGADIAYVSRGFTAQAEANVMQGVRVRGSTSAGGTDPFRTSAAVAMHAGYFLGSHVSLGADLRYQRWLSHPTTLDAMTGARVPLPDANMDLVTAAAGVRLHFRMGTRASIHPGISYTRGVDPRGLDAPLINARTNAVQIDVPVTF